MAFSEASITEDANVAAVNEPRSIPEPGAAGDAAPWYTERVLPNALAQTPGTSAFAINFQGVVYAGVSSACLALMAFLCRQPLDLAHQWLGALGALLAFVGLRHFSLAVPWRIGRPASDGIRLLKLWCLIAAAVLLASVCTAGVGQLPMKVCLLWLGATPFALLLLNASVHGVARLVCPEWTASRKALLVAGDALMASEPLFQMVEFYEEEPQRQAGEPANHHPRTGTVSDVMRYVRDEGIGVVFISMPVEHGDQALPLLEALGDTTASVYYIPRTRALEPVGARLLAGGPLPTFEVMETPFSGVDAMVKRLFDIVFTLAALAALGVPMLIIAAAIKLGSPGPVLFRQLRYGLNGREFFVLKFRSMVVAERDAELAQVTRDDARVTPVGRMLRRSSMDELPQLFNVLKGEMSIVGPRPHTVAHNEFYRKAVRNYMLRHKVKPGLTGLAQAHGLRGETPRLELMERRVQYDLEYIRRWSVSLDIEIIFRTVGLVLRGHNAY